MKLSKKLIPLLTIGSTIAVIAPSITSCSSALASANSFDYKPQAKYASQSIKISEESKIATVAHDYFANPQYFAQDWLYAKAQAYTKAKQELNSRYDDVELTFNATVDKSSFEKKIFKLTKPEQSEEKEITGYVINAQISCSRKYSYTLNSFSDPEDAKLYKKYRYSNESNGTITIQDAFAFVHYVTVDTIKKPTIYIWYNDNVSDNWAYKDVLSYSEVCEFTHMDGTVTTDKESNTTTDYVAYRSGASVSNLFDAGITDANGFRDVMTDIQLLWGWDYNIYTVIAQTGSYYLSDITFTE